MPLLLSLYYPHWGSRDGGGILLGEVTQKRSPDGTLWSVTRGHRRPPQQHALLAARQEPPQRRVQVVHGGRHLCL